MIKFLLILFLICYALYRVGGFLFKIMSIGASQAQQQKQQSTRRKAPQSNLNIDHMPKKHAKGYEGGDYVDFEEVKDS